MEEGGGKTAEQLAAEAEALAAATQAADTSAAEGDALPFEFDDDGGEGGGEEGGGTGAAAAPVKPAFNRDRWRAIDETIDDEDKLFEHVTKFREENKNLRALAAGREVIDNDQQLNNLKGLLKESRDGLAMLKFVNEYKSDGLPDADAQVRAQEKLSLFKEKGKAGEVELDDMVRAMRTHVSGLIENRTKSLTEELQAAAKAVDLRTISKAKADDVSKHLSKMTDFLGFTLPEQTRGKVIEKAAKLAQSDDFSKLLNDPAEQAEFAMYKAHKEQWIKNIRKRANGNQSLLDKSRKEPPITGNRAHRNPNMGKVPKSASEINASEFLGGGKGKKK